MRIQAMEVRRLGRLLNATHTNRSKGPLMVGRTVTQYMRAGVAALHLEDQVVTKRCGHLLNKQVVSSDEFLSRIRAAVLARSEQPGGDIVIIARTDALQSLGYEAARDRLREALQAGADCGFLEGVRTAQEARQIVVDLAPSPVLFNCVSGGVSPEWSAEEAKELGFRVVIHPGFALGPVYTAIKAAAHELVKTGKASNTGNEISPKQIFQVCGLDKAIEFDVAAGGKLFAQGV